MRKKSFIVTLFCVASLLIGVAGSIALMKTSAPSKPSGLIQLRQSMTPFTLTADDNTPFTNANLQGKWTIVFFGYTHCPDICPTTMYSMTNIMAQLAAEDKALHDTTQVVFVSVDAQRDTTAQLNKYMAFFNPDFIGVTGTESALSQFAKNLFAIYETPDSSQTNYLVNHSGNLHIINPDGAMVAILKEPIDDTVVARYLFVANSSAP